MKNSEQFNAKAGIGNWSGFNASGLSIHDAIEIAQGWREKLQGVTKPWLCWNVNNDWCILQQRLVEHVGWTPIVGFDPRVGAPPLTENAILMDFNEEFDLPVMYPHFPVELTFAFADRLAFWHSDLLVREHKLKAYAQLFEGLKDGEMVATDEQVSWREKLKPKSRRYWELLGCMTKEASQSNFDHGCGWWLNFYDHQNGPKDGERAARAKYHWECGVGIRYWKNKCGGKVITIAESEIDEGHFTRINNSNYVVTSPNDWRRDVSKDLVKNFELKEACTSLGLENFLIL